MDALARLILRVGFGALMLGHGIGKLQMVIDGNFAFADPIGIGAKWSLILAMLAEFAGSICVILGLWTRFAAFAIVFTMLVAVVTVHAEHPWISGPGVKASKEGALLHFLGFVAILLLGAGPFSLDATLTKRKAAPPPE